MQAIIAETLMLALLLEYHHGQRHHRGVKVGYNRLSKKADIRLGAENGFLRF